MGSIYNNLQSHPYQKDQSHPYQKDQSQYRPVAMPPHMYMNPPQPSTRHGYWPWANNYGHASPVACHGFCSHSYYPPHPAYAWGSAYSHVPPYQCPGSYHPYPIQYMPPPGCLPESWYECEKRVSGVHHCCGCPHHPQHQKDQSSVRIEEEEPAGERGVITKGESDDSKFPFRFSKQPYPIVWFPPDYSSSENGHKENSPNARPIDSRRSGDAGLPSLWNGWYPFDLNRLALSKQGEDQEKNNHHQQDNEAKGRLPFPLVWMPYEPRQQEKEEQSDSSSLQGQKSNDLTTSWVKDAPAMKVEHPEEKENSQIGDQGIVDASGNGSISSKVKDIPVKELGQDPEMNASGNESISSKVKNIPVKELGQHEKQKVSDEKKQLDNGSKKSKSKSSKLPPVCLRIDPLPKRSSKRSAQWSPSPLGEKQKPNKSPDEESNTPSPSVSKKNNDTMEKEAIGITKNIEVVDGRSQQGENHKEMPICNQVNTQQVQDDHKEENTPSQKCSEPDVTVAKDRSENTGSKRTEDQELVGSKELRMKKLSEEEAAMAIQSVFRGFEVRKWEPIRKLKQIAEVRKQIVDVKDMIQSLGSFSNTEDKSRQRTVIGEMLMSLLLKLDNIQGLLPIVREIRKSAVRELVNLQEQLDSIKNDVSESETIPLQEAEIAAVKKEDAHQSLLNCEVEQAQANANAAGESSENVQMTLEARPDAEAANGKLAKDVVESGMCEETVTESPKGIVMEGIEDDESLMNVKITESQGPEPLILQGGSVEETDFEDNARGDFGNDQLDTPEVNPTEEVCAIKTKEAPTSNEASVGKEEDLVIDDSNRCEEVVPLQVPESGVAHEEDDMNNEQVNLTQEKAYTAVEGSENIQTTLESDPDAEEEANDTAENHTSEESALEDSTRNDKEVILDDNSPMNANTNLQPDSLEGSNSTENMKLNPAVKEACDQSYTVNKEEDERSYTTSVKDAADGIDSSANTSPYQEVQVADGDTVAERNRKLIEENESLKEMMEKLVESGKEQVDVVSALTRRVKDLEKMVSSSSRKRKVKVQRRSNKPQKQKQ